MVLDLLAWLGVTKPEHIPNAITGLFGFAGVVLTGLAAIIAWLLKQIILRHEKRNDLRAALHAEIEALWQSMAVSPPSPHLLAEVGNRMRAPGGRRYTPHFSRYPAVDIFTAMRADIAALGRDEIPHVVRFYHHMTVLDHFTAELRDPAFRGFPVERKVMMTNHQFKMVLQAIEFAETALHVLEHKLELEPSRRIAVLKQALEARRGPSPQGMTASPPAATGGTPAAADQR